MFFQAHEVHFFRWLLSVSFGLIWTATKHKAEVQEHGYLCTRNLTSLTESVLQQKGMYLQRRTEPVAKDVLDLCGINPPLLKCLYFIAGLLSKTRCIIFTRH